MDLNYFYSAMLSLTSTWQLLLFVDCNISNGQCSCKPSTGETLRLLTLVRGRRPAVACSTIDKKRRRRSTNHDRLLNGSKALIISWPIEWKLCCWAVEPLSPWLCLMNYYRLYCGMFPEPFNEDILCSAFLRANIPLKKINNKALSWFFKQILKVWYSRRIHIKKKLRSWNLY